MLTLFTTLEKNPKNISPKSTDRHRPIEPGKFLVANSHNFRVVEPPGIISMCNAEPDGSSIASSALRRPEPIILAVGEMGIVFVFRALYS